MNVTEQAAVAAFEDITMKAAEVAGTSPEHYAKLRVKLLEALWALSDPPQDCRLATILLSDVIAYYLATESGPRNGQMVDPTINLIHSLAVAYQAIAGVLPEIGGDNVVPFPAGWQS